MNRFYLRCTACCHVFVVETEAATPYPGRQCECGGCGGDVVVMGKVGRDPRRLVRETERCPCDARCTHACGPRCDCPCGSVNHGTGRVVIVVIDAGAVPRVVPGADDVAACQARRAEFEGTFETAMQTIRHRYPELALRRERYLDNAEFARWLDAQRRLTAVQKTKALKTHDGRLKALAKATAEPVAAPMVAA